MIALSQWLGAIVFIALISLGGCSTSPEPFEYQSNRELKKGPGVVSGEDGVFTIYRKPALREDNSSATKD